MHNCSICQNSVDNTLHIFREMMYGLGDPFEYMECAHCGCLQILKVPGDLHRYYGDTYCSFGNIPKIRDNVVKAKLKKIRIKAFLKKKSFFGKIFLAIYQQPDYFNRLKNLNLKLDSSILDVGCGAGHLLLRMRKDGFQDLMGVDLFVENDLDYGNGVQIYKKSIAEVEQQFDFIMLNHSFEHMPNPLDTMKELNRCLKKDRFILIRIPVTGTYAWKKYGADWVQIDAPRHLHLYSMESMEILANKSGFIIKNIFFDSTEFQFWGSEQNLKNIPLNSEKSFATNKVHSIFSGKQMKSFKKHAIKLNKNLEGDMACFFLYKT